MSYTYADWEQLPNIFVTVGAHKQLGIHILNWKQQKRVWGRGSVVGCCQSQSKDSNPVMYFDHNPNNIGTADCISPVMSISVISDAGGVSHIVYYFFICFMLFTVLFNVDTRSSNFNSRSTRVPVCASSCTPISVTLTHCKLFPLLVIYISPFLLIFSSLHNISWSEKLMYNSRLKIYSSISLYNQLVSTTVDDLKFDACSVRTYCLLYKCFLNYFTLWFWEIHWLTRCK